MNTCVIFCAGGFDRMIEPVDETDLVIAADGGLNYVNQLGLTPDIILGDFDSLGYVPEGANVYPVEKDDTDAMLAIRQGLERGFCRFVLYGCLDGPRLDHTVAALQSLQFLADRGAIGYLMGLQYIAAAVQNGSLRFPADAAGILSLFCMGEDAKGVTLENLQYTLSNATLTSHFPLGVSNHFIGKEAKS